MIFRSEEKLLIVLTNRMRELNRLFTKGADHSTVRKFPDAFVI